MASAPRALTKNWHLKLASIGLAIFLWALVQSEPLSEETFSAVPVTVVVSDTTWILSGAPSPPTVDLRLGGPARAIIGLARDGTTLRVPITSVGSRDTTITVQREWVQLGQRAGVTVESVSPQTLNFTFERAASRTIPLALRIQGELPSNLALSTEPALNPAEVAVRGPESRLRGLDSIPLLAFDLRQVRESGVFTIAVDTAGLAGASVVPPDAALGVRVEALEERVLESVIVQAGVGAGASNVVVDPPTVQLRLAGARTLVTAMDLSLLQVSVASESVRGMEPGEVRRVRLQIDGLPPLITAYPSTEVVTVRRQVGPAGGAERNRP
jgi:YbbR domain-containing protein